MDILGMTAAEVDQKTGEGLVELAYQAAHIVRSAEALLVRVSGSVQAECEGVPAEESLARQYGVKNAQELLRMITLAPSRVVAARLRLAANTRQQVTLTGQVLPPKCPYVSKALEEGALPVESAAHITKLIEKTEEKAHPEDLQAAECSLVEAATGLEFTMDADTGEVMVEQPLEPEGEPEPADDGPVSAGDAGGDCGSGSGQDTGEDSGEDSGEGPVEDAGGGRGGGSPVVRVPLDADAIRGVCSSWEAGLDPDGSLPSEAEMMRRRSVRFGPERGGLVSLYMDLMPEVAARLSRMFDALGNPRVRNQTGKTLNNDDGDSGDGGDSGDSGDSGGGGALSGVSAHLVDGRTPDQKRHDMFATVLDTAL